MSLDCRLCLLLSSAALTSLSWGLVPVSPASWDSPLRGEGIIPANVPVGLGHDVLPQRGGVDGLQASLQELLEIVGTVGGFE